MLSASIVIGKYNICVLSSLVPKIRCTYMNSQALIIFDVKNGPEKWEVSGNNCSEYSSAYWHGTFQPNIRANLDWFVTIRNWLGIVLHMLWKWVICHKPFPLLNGVLASIFVLKVVLLSLENILVEWFNFVCSYIYPILPYVFITSRVPIIATLYHYHDIRHIIASIQHNSCWTNSITVEKKLLKLLSVRD
jgi:uncharacterized protein YqhQ